MIETLQDVLDTVIGMLCAELSCSASDLTDGKVHFRVRDKNLVADPAHRKFPPHPGRIEIVSMGTGGVVCVDEGQEQWVIDVFGDEQDATRDSIFLPEKLGMMSELVSRDQLILRGPYPRFAVSHSSLIPVPPPSGYTIRVVDKQGADNISDRDKWGYAIYPDPEETQRPTMLAGIAERDGTVVGVCGASADSDSMWQLGINVEPEHQGYGLSTALVSSVAEAVLEADKLPYYGTSGSNVLSMRTALAVGFKPTWVEVLSRPTGLY